MRKTYLRPKMLRKKNKQTNKQLLNTFFIELLTEVVRDLLVEHDVLGAALLGRAEGPQVLDGELLSQAPRVDFDPPVAFLHPERFCDLSKKKTKQKTKTKTKKINSERRQLGFIMKKSMLASRRRNSGGGSN